MKLETKTFSISRPASFTPSSSSDSVSAIAWLTPTAGAYSSPSQLLCATDDGLLAHFTSDGEILGSTSFPSNEGQSSVNIPPSYGIMDLHASPSMQGLFAAACSDGALRLLSRGGSVEERRSETSSAGAAALCVRWSPDGGAIATGAEDGSVRIFSRSALLRTQLANTGRAIYCLAWGPDGQSLVYSSGKDLTISPLGAESSSSSNTSSGGSGGLFVLGATGGQGGMLPSSNTSQSSFSPSAPISWRAHDAPILCCSWSHVSGRIVSGGEDQKYRVWDTTGRQLFVSSPFEHVVTSVAWSPCGGHFAVGCFDTLRLCDKQGRGYSRERIEGEGSVQCLSWSADGTMVAAGCGNGKLLLCNLLRKVRASQSKDGLEATQTDMTHISVLLPSAEGSNTQPSGPNAASVDREELDFRDRVVEFAVGFGHLVVSTPTQCHIFSLQTGFHSPLVFDLRAPARLIILSERYFLAAEMGGLAPVAGGTNLAPSLVSSAVAPAGTAQIGGTLTAYTYDGRTLCSIRYPTLKVDLLSHSTVSASPDVIAVLDRSLGDGGRTIRLFDVRNGRGIGQNGSFVHSSPISFLALSMGPLGGMAERKLLLIDAAKELWIVPILRASQATIQTNSSTLFSSKATSGAIRLLGVCDSAAWSEAPSDALIAIADSRLHTWTCPQGFWIDPDLAQASKLGNSLFNLSSTISAISPSNFTSNDSFSSSDAVALVSTTGTGGGVAASFGAIPIIEAFTEGGRLVVRKGDGSLAHALVTGAVACPLLYACTVSNRWNEAIRLCRFARSAHLWAALACLSLGTGRANLDAAEIALAALGAIDKLQFVLHVKRMILPEVRAAELSLFRRNPDEGESILLSYNPPLIYRAVKLNIHAARWTRALDIAQSRKEHVDTVLILRQRHLAALGGLQETLPQFVSANAAQKETLNWSVIKARNHNEKARESQMSAQMAAQSTSGNVQSLQLTSGGKVEDEFLG
jgi:intraflagellar transport protein 80